ncbi:MAG: 2'-5' RNA ligase family protein [Patescibacteria group bacterium]
MSHRVFVALPISPALQSEIIAWEQQFPGLPVRWLKGKNLHITLVPPWETDDTDKITTLLNCLNNAGGRIELIFDRVTFGPNLREPRLIWAEGSTPPLIVKLKAQLEQTLALPQSQRTSATSPRMSAKERVFLLHLTLARFRPEQFHSLPVKTFNETVDWQDTASTFVLMESHLLPSGADYEILAKFPFTSS